MNLINMKSDEGTECCAPESNPYGYGLRIHLNDDQVEALGIKTPPTAGTVVQVVALATVVTVEQRTEVDGDDKGPDISLCLQITDMALEQPKASLESRIYKGTKA